MKYPPCPPQYETRPDQERTDNPWRLRKLPGMAWADELVSRIKGDGWPRDKK